MKKEKPEQQKNNPQVTILQNHAIIEGSIALCNRPYS